MKYYLCGPIDSIGHKSDNVAAFEEATKKLRKLGFTVMSPVELGTDGLPYLEFIRRDMKQLLECDGLILLPGWPQSRGCKIEVMLAMQLNMKLFYYIANTVRLLDMNL